jgi:Uri superfamily endonuclease
MLFISSKNSKTSGKTELLISSKKGTYVLILYLSKDENLNIGKLGHFSFESGFYAYIGSAFGPGGIDARLKHHLNPSRNPNWHIDYFKAVAEVKEIWFIEGERYFEHLLANILQEMEGVSVPVKNFGATDCHCETHFFKFDKYKDLQSFKRSIKDNFPKYV